jgi:hypothetical protein
MRSRCHAVLLVLAVLALPAAAAIGCGGADGGGETIDVRVGDRLSIDADLARTAAERDLGLGNRDSLARDRGMLFVFAQPGRHVFWMHRMRFALDFIWISEDRRVVQVTENVPPPEPGTATGDLPRYAPDQPVRYVLEVSAGVAAEAGVRPGDVVSFEPEVTTQGVE